MARTVKVKIAVCVDEEGGWQAYGYSGAMDDDNMSEAHGGVKDTGGVAEYFITAELPIPEPVTVEGNVTSASPVEGAIHE